MLKTQKPICLLLLFLSLVVIKASAQQPTNPQQYSLQEAIDYAIKNNTEILNADLENKISQKQINEILADGLPQVFANLDLVNNHNIQTAFVPANAFDPSGDPNEVGALAFGVNYTGLASLRVEQMIFDGSFFVGLQAARIYTELSRKAHIKTTIDVVEAVTKAYYTVLINREMAELVTKNYTRLDSLLTDTKIMYQNGFVEQIDVDRIKVEHNNVKVEKDHLDKMLRISESLFKFQAGFDLNAQIELTDKIDNVVLDKHVEKVDNFNYENRIEYSSLQTQKTLNNLDLKNTKSQYIPKVNLYATYGANTGTQKFGGLFDLNEHPWHRLGVIGVGMNWQIFDGMRKSAQAQQKKYKAEQIENDISSAMVGIDLEIEQSISDYNKSIDNMNAQKENMELARNIYETTEIKYKEGVGSNSEVLDADASLKQSQTNYYNAFFEALVSRVELQKALGELYK
ncbi:TolC family protein [Reichenbachiella sp. MALMAid0571]|uniref:TolC family protein n=1 Tax=Reichenbachiella sp. MALMAid0571 TaxID=3143939 RepID=UPI0032DF5ED7